MARFFIAVALWCTLLLTGCGGGGGSSTDATNRGEFTLSASSVTFTSKRNAAAPAAQAIQVTLTGTGTAIVGAGYKQGVTPPDWLQVTASGAGSVYAVSLAIKTTNLAIANYSTTLTIGTSDASGNILQTKDVQIAYNVRDGLVIAPATLLNASMISGSSDATRSLSLALQAPSNVQWTATSNFGWLISPAPSQGGGQVNVQINSTGLTAGSYRGTVTFTNSADPTDTASADVDLQISLPTFNSPAQTLQLRDEAGLSSITYNISTALSTGSNAYPLTVTATTTSGGNWLIANASSSTVSGTPTTLNVLADRSQLLAVSRYSGEVTIRATVLGQQISQTFPVTYNYDRNRLWVEANGVAFSSFPHRPAVLSRSMVVHSAWDGPSMDWQATSSANWLSVTASGTTGGLIQLTANPAGLSGGQYYADVTITSADVRVANQETIRVGLTVGATDPVSSFNLPSIVTDLVATNPVEPSVYAVVNSGTQIAVIDVNTLIASAPISGMFTEAKAITTGGDGRTLYIVDRNGSSDRIVELDLATRTIKSTYPLSSPASNPAIVYGRADAYPILWSLATHEAIDLTTGNIRTTAISGPAVSFSWPTGKTYLVEQNTGFSPSTITNWEVRYSTLPGAGILLTQRQQNPGLESNYTRSNGRDLAVSYLGNEVFVAAGAPYQFDVLESATLLLTRNLAGNAYPNNAETCWNGLFAGGADASGNPAGDIWVYDSNGALRGQLDSGTDSLFTRALLFSGDCMRLISGSGAGLKFQDVP